MHRHIPHQFLGVHHLLRVGQFALRDLVDKDLRAWAEAT
jgi:hypothetical protein